MLFYWCPFLILAWLVIPGLLYKCHGGKPWAYGYLFMGGQAATATSATAAIYRLEYHSSISWTTWFDLVAITSYTTGVPLLPP